MNFFIRLYNRLRFGRPTFHLPAPAAISHADSIDAIIAQHGSDTAALVRLHAANSEAAANRIIEKATAAASAIRSTTVQVQ